MGTRGNASGNIPTEGATRKLPAHERALLDNMFYNVNDTSYHNSNLQARPGIYWTDIISPAGTVTLVSKKANTTEPGLEGIQLPNGYKKVTARKHTPTDSTSIVRLYIKYGTSPTSNDTTYYNSLNVADSLLKYDFYKEPTNYTTVQKKGGCVYKKGKRVK